MMMSRSDFIKFWKPSVLFESWGAGTKRVVYSRKTPGQEPNSIHRVLVRRYYADVLIRKQRIPTPGGLTYYTLQDTSHAPSKLHRTEKNLIQFPREDWGA